MNRKILFWFLMLMPLMVATGEAGPINFTLPSLSGPPVSLKDYRGKKTVVVNFWASWCDACQEEIPLLNALQKKYEGQPLVFLGVNAGEDARRVEKFVSKTGYAYQILLDREKSVARDLQVMSLPQTLVISKEGEIIYRESRPPAEIHFP